MATEEKKYGFIPYLFLFSPILISPFLDKSFLSMSLIMPWAFALFVYPLFLLAEKGRTRSYHSILKSHVKGEKTQVLAPARKKNWVEYSWLAPLPSLFALILLGVNFQITYSLLAIFALLLATLDSYPEFVESKVRQ